MDHLFLHEAHFLNELYQRDVSFKEINKVGFLYTSYDNKKKISDLKKMTNKDNYFKKQKIKKNTLKDEILSSENPLIRMNVLFVIQNMSRNNMNVDQLFSNRGRVG